MRKKAIILALVLCLALTLAVPSLAQAKGGLTIMNSSATAVFPSRLNFSLSARSDVNITDIRLCYAVERTGFAEVTSEAYIDFVPATEVDVSWSLEMVMLGGLPTGSVVEYWWRVTDDNGQQLETTPAYVEFNDTNYEWSSLTEGKITIYCYQGDEEFVAELMEAAQAALETLAEDTGAELEKPAKLFIYANTTDLQEAMISPQEWTGGVAFTRLGIIAIGISQTNISWGKNAIAHELAHLVVHQMTLNPYNDLPTWLDEGLAMYAQEERDSAFDVFLEVAIDGGGLISVQSLCSPFSAYSDEATLSYAESYSLVEYLISEYGQDEMLELLNVFSEGSGYDDALEAVYGFDMDTLDSLWREHISK